MTTSENDLRQRFDLARYKLGVLVTSQAKQAGQLMRKGYYASENAPNNLATMRLAWAEGSSYPVYSGASDKTVYSTPEQNLAFRFWHDVLHLVYDLDVSFEEELQIAKIHQKSARQYYGPDAALLMRIDTRGQSEYYKEHGAFPEDQLAFAWVKWQEMA